MIPIQDNLDCQSKPIATYLLILLNCLAFCLEVFLPEAASNALFENWAVVPAKVSAAFASGDISLICLAMLSTVTAMFLHGGFAHIAGNMVFLQAFGRAVENRFGSLCFVLFYLLGGSAAWGFHFLTDPQSHTSALGASGAIAAVLGAYLLFYPKAKFLTIFFIPIPIPAFVRAYWLLAIWFASQILPGVSEVLNPAGAGVAYWAHIGGFIAGLSLASLWAVFSPVSDVCYRHTTGSALTELKNVFTRKKCDKGCGNDKSSGGPNCNDENNDDKK